MTYTFTYEVPVGTAIYAPHQGRYRPGARARHDRASGIPSRNRTFYADVWQSKDDWDAFEQDRLNPVVQTLLQEILGLVPPEPSRTMLDLVDAGLTITRTRHDIQVSAWPLAISGLVLTPQRLALPEFWEGQPARLM